MLANKMFFCVCVSENRQKTSRVITYPEFLKALQDLAPKRFRGQSQEEALMSIYRLVEKGGPTNTGVTVRQHCVERQCYMIHDIKQARCKNHHQPDLKPEAVNRRSPT